MGAERAGGMHVVHQNEGRIGRATYLRIYGAFPPPRSRPLLRRTPTSPLPPSFVPSASYLSRTGRDDRATAWRSLAHRKKLASIPLLSSDIGASGGEGGRPPWLRFMLYRIICERTDGRADVGAALIVRCSPRRLCAAPRLNFLLLSLLRRGGRRPTTATTSRSRRE